MQQRNHFRRDNVLFRYLKIMRSTVILSLMSALSFTMDTEASTLTPPPITCPPYSTLGCYGSDFFTCLNCSQSNQTTPIPSECDGAETIRNFCGNSTCLLSSLSNLNGEINEESYLELCRNQSKNTLRSCPSFFSLCSRLNTCDVPGYPSLNCQQNETLCLELCRNESFIDSTQNCSAVSIFCENRFCDVYGYALLDCFGADNEGCLQYCPIILDRIDDNNVTVNSPDRCETIVSFCDNGTCEYLKLLGFLTLSELDCADDTPMCLTICRNETINRLYRRCNGQREVTNLCTDLTEMLLQDGLSSDVFNVAIDIADVIVSQPESSLNGSISIIGSVVTALEANGSESAVLFENDTNIDSVIGLVDQLLHDDDANKWNRLRTDEYGSADTVLNQLETISRLVGRSYIDGNRTESYVFSSNNTVLFVEIPDVSDGLNNSNGTPVGFYKFPRSVGTFQSELNSFISHMIPLNLLCDGNDCSGVVSTTVVRNLPTYLDKSVQHSSQYTNSFLLSLEIQNPDSQRKNFSKDGPNILVQFKPLETNESVVDFSSHVCVFWDFTASNWSSEGIVTSITDENEIMCNVSHLTSFAVLVSPTGDVGRGQERAALNIISYIGCVISILCLIATIFILVGFRKRLNKGVLLYVHLNLSIALLIALLIFVVGIETAVSVEPLCIIVAALLHYFFLCVFCWMLAEGIMLYLLIVRVFGSAADKWYYLMFLGWGLPVPIVLITASVLQTNYISDDYCWLRGDPKQAAIWTFLAPMTLIILVNTVILIMTAFSIVRGKKRGGAEMEVKKKQLVGAAIKSSLILLPLLGVTWIVGIFAVSNNTTVFAWLFTILNSLQGVFILILHVLRNELVLKKMLYFFLWRPYKQDTFNHQVLPPISTLGKGITATQEIYLKDALKREEAAEPEAHFEMRETVSLKPKMSQQTITSETMLIDDVKM